MACQPTRLTVYTLLGDGENHDGKTTDTGPSDTLTDSDAQTDLSAGDPDLLLGPCPIANPSHPLASYIPDAVYQRINGEVIIFGGESAGALTRTTQLYDPNTNQWIRRRPMPIARKNSSSVAFREDKILLCGGQNSSGVTLRSCDIYDAGADTWTAATPMSVPRHRLSMIHLNTDRVVAVGGSNGSGPLDSTELYDPATNQWTAASSMNRQRSGSLTNLLSPGDRFLLVGGETSDDPYSAISSVSAEIYDVNGNSWASVPNTPSGLVPYGRVAIDAADIFFVGTYGAAIFNVGSLSWSAVAPPPSPRVGATAVPRSGVSAHVYGGFWNQPTTFAFSTIDAYDYVGNTWSTAPGTHSPRGNAIVLQLLSGEFLLVGGINPSGSLASDAELVDSATGSLPVATMCDLEF